MVHPLRCALALLLGLLAACGGDRPNGTAEGSADAPQVARGGRTLVLVAIDRLRRDALGAYGARPDPTPHSSDLAARSWVFEDHLAATVGLNASLATLLTGSFARDHGIGSLRERGQATLAASRTTLAEHLSAAGWRTFAVFSSPQLDPAVSGLAQGFDEVRAPALQEARTRTVEASWLDARAPLARLLREDVPVFALLQLSDLGLPDLPARASSAAFLRARLGPYSGGDPLLASALQRFDDDPAAGVKELADLLRRSRGAPEYLAWEAASYDARLALVDDALGDLLALLDETGRRAQAVVAVTSTRGLVRGAPEAGAPGFAPELVRLPLVLAAPGAYPARLARPTSAVDVAPTLLDALGLPPLPGATGRSALDAEQDFARFCEAGVGESVAAFGSRYHVEENRIAGDVAYRADGMRVARESELDEAGHAEVAGLRMALATFRRPARLVVATGGAAPLDVRCRLDDGYARAASVTSTDGVTRAVSPRGQTVALTLARDETRAVVETSRRSLPCRLDLARPGDDAVLADADVELGAAGLSLASSLLPRLPVGPRVPWECTADGTLAPAAVSLEQQSGTWWWLHVGAEDGAGVPPGSEVEVLVALYPPREPYEELGCRTDPGARVAPLPGRDDAVRVVGPAPLSLQLEKTPGREFALAVRVAGQGVTSDRFRLDDARFRAPGTLSLYLPDWLPEVTGDLASGDGAPAPGHVRVARDGPDLPDAERTPLPNDARRALERLEAGE